MTHKDCTECLFLDTPSTKLTLFSCNQHMACFRFTLLLNKVHVALLCRSVLLYEPLGIRILSITQPTRDELLSGKKLICFKLCSSLKRSNLTTVVVVFIKRRVRICNHMTIRIQYLHASLKPCK